jgi:hypothetical protein
MLDKPPSFMKTHAARTRCSLSPLAGGNQGGQITGGRRGGVHHNSLPSSGIW